MIKRFQLYISGGVQGVGFRAYAALKARALGVTGYVRNLSDGRVEVFAEGNVGSLEPFIAWCHQGPSLARVEQVEIHELDSGLEEKKFNHFDIQ